MPKPKALATRVAFVTGGGSGIGRAIAIRLAAEGACVVVADRDADAAAKVAFEIGSTDVAVSVAADVTSEDDVAAGIAAGVLAFGGVDLIVNNAGLSISKSLLETTVADWDLQHDVMARGSFLVSREAAKVMIEQQMGGDIVYISSQELRVRRPEQHRVRRDQGRPGPPGPAARGRARRPRRAGQRHQPRRRRTRLRHLRQRLGRQSGRCLRSR